MSFRYILTALVCEHIPLNASRQPIKDKQSEDHFRKTCVIKR